MTTLIQDLRHTVRSFSRNKGFTAIVLGVLALGIGATTAVFSVVSGVILRPLPFTAQDRLVQLYGTPVERGQALLSSDVEEFRTTSGLFEAIAGYSVGARYLQSPDGSEQVMTVDVERGFFAMLGVKPKLGRWFGPEDSSNVALAGEAFWRRWLRGDPAAIGSAITIDGSSWVIIGVMPESFQFPYNAASLLQGAASQGRTDLWLLRDSPPGQPRRGRLSYVTGKLKTDVSLSAAQSELSLIMKRIEAQSPERIKGLGVRLMPLSDAVVSPPVRRSLFILFGAAGLVLLLACANVMNLFLVRVTLRKREFASRIALGASPWRLVQQFLTESLVVAFIAGAASLLIAWLGTHRLLQFAAAQIPRSHEAGMDWRVFLFSTGICTISAVIFGVAPALSALRANPQSALTQTSSHSTMSRQEMRLRDGLVSAEVAMAFVLGVGALLLMRELIRLRQTDTGMVAQSVITFHIGQRMTPGMSGRQFYEIADRVRQVPGVREAGFTQMLPLQNSGWTGNSSDMRVRGRSSNDVPLFSIELRYVTPGYFQALGIPIRRGRAFTEQDDANGQPVIMINETLAGRLFGADEPIGQLTTRGTIIGVVRDVLQVHLDRPAVPEVYYPIAQNWSQVGELGMSLVVQTVQSPETLIGPIRSAIREMSPGVAIFNIKTMDRIVEDSMLDFTLYLSLMSAFAGLALVLASSGAYCVISYMAAMRQREFAVRMALGAERSQVYRLVLREAIVCTAIGLGAGLALVIAIRPLLQSLPVSVRGPDAVIVLPVATVILIVAVVACLVPAHRAASADPMIALRNDC